MSAPGRFEVDQTVYYAWTEQYGKRRSRIEPVVISKVGRKWAEFSNGRDRFDVRTMEVDGGNYLSEGRVYRAESDYQRDLKAREAWDQLQRFVSRHRRPPAGVYLSAIITAADMLGCTITPPAPPDEGTAS